MLLRNEILDMAVDFGRLDIRKFVLEEWGQPFHDMQSLEQGAIANPTENRQVGHYWLRAPMLAPSEYAQEILESWVALEELEGRIPEHIENFLMVGIGGSALGPQFLEGALETKGLQIYFLDNTDPDGMDRVLQGLDLGATIVGVLSKSGGTKETRNAMLETRKAFEEQGIPFVANAIAITGTGSALYQQAQKEGWFGVLPLWDWVGGRTSITGMVGLLPLMLMKRDWKRFLAGAAEMDAWTRSLSAENPALQMAHAWFELGEGKGNKAMVALPYKDSLLLLGRYLQQLIMESLGKNVDLEGNIVHQGLTVYGNKGSTDQHAFVQQLRDGRHDFFVNFFAVLESRTGYSIEVDEGHTSGDYLLGFLMGTRNALTEAGRSSLTVIIPRVDEWYVGALIALYERVVGFYASKIGVNAYDQPGVEAGKKAAQNILDLQQKIMAGEEVPDDDDAWLLRKYLDLR